MKAYGHSRTDKLECKYGCCTGKSGKEKNCRDSVDRANRKTARREAKEEASSELHEELYYTQGGGRVKYEDGNYIFVEKPDCPGFEVGDIMPTEWGVI